MSMAAMMSAMPPSLGYGYMPTSPTLSSPTGPGGFPEASIGVPQSAVTPQGLTMLVFVLYWLGCPRLKIVEPRTEFWL
jgi:hypothetical protein